MSENAVSGVLRTANRLIRRRNSLKTLQLSADDQEVVRPSMVYPKDKALSKKKQSNAVEKLVSEKENVSSLRRSKRKVGVSDQLNYAESHDGRKTNKPAPKPKTVAKPKNKTVKSKKGHSGTVKKADLNQTKLEFPPVTSEENKADIVEPAPSAKISTEASTSTLTVDSGIDPSDSSEEHSRTFINETKLQFTVSTPTQDKDTSLITSATPSLQYWQEIAEQRRIALEKVLRDNELIYDQLIVLEAENSQLRQLLKEAENLASIVKSIVE